MAEPPAVPPAPAPDPGRTPLPVWSIVGVLVGVLTCVVLIGILMWRTRMWPFAADEPPPADVLADVRAADEQRLAGYGWVEKPAAGKAGVVRIPVERAAELWLAEEGKR